MAAQQKGGALSSKPASSRAACGARAIGALWEHERKGSVLAITAVAAQRKCSVLSRQGALGQARVDECAAAENGPSTRAGVGALRTDRQFGQTSCFHFLEATPPGRRLSSQPSRQPPQNEWLQGSGKRQRQCF